MLKRILTLTLALALLCGSALAAEHLEGYYTPPPMNEGQYPIDEEGVTLTYWMPINSGAANFISSYDENPSYQAVQANTAWTLSLSILPPAPRWKACSCFWPPASCRHDSGPAGGPGILAD